MVAAVLPFKPPPLPEDPLYSRRVDPIRNIRTQLLNRLTALNPWHQLPGPKQAECIEWVDTLYYRSVQKLARDEFYKLQLDSHYEQTFFKTLPHHITTYTELHTWVDEQWPNQKRLTPYVEALKIAALMQRQFGTTEEFAKQAPYCFGKHIPIQAPGRRLLMTRSRMVYVLQYTYGEVEGSLAPKAIQAVIDHADRLFHLYQQTAAQYQLLDNSYLEQKERITEDVVYIALMVTTLNLLIDCPCVHMWGRSFNFNTFSILRNCFQKTDEDQEPIRQIIQWGRDARTGKPIVTWRWDIYKSFECYLALVWGHEHMYPLRIE